MQFLSDSYDKLLKEVTGLREENKRFEKSRSIEKGSAAPTFKRAAWGQLNIDQYNRRIRLEISGAALKCYQKDENIIDLLREIAWNRPSSG